MLRRPSDEIYKNSDVNRRTVFLGDRNVEKMQKHFTAHAGSACDSSSIACTWLRAPNLAS